jgi:hypothetical protein
MTELVVFIEEQNLVSASTNLSNPALLESLDNVGDIDVSSGKQNGSVLVYKTTTNKWTATKTLDLQNLEGGEF